VNKQELVSLLEQMTLDEKISQLIQLATPFYEGNGDQGQITGPMAEMGISPETVRNSGSVLGASGAEATNLIQKNHLEKNRLGIPLLFMADIVHGFKTIFPVPLAIGCSWDLQLAEKSAEIAAREASASGVHVTFAPMVDLVRDPRWGRVMESTGEDPYLNSEFARSFVRGFQGSDLQNDQSRVAACVKHFAAYGAVEGGRDYNTVNMSERQLREVYLPAYKAALDEGVEMVMTAFNTVDGIPATGNKWLMRDLLREEWGFEGVLISDWGAAKEMILHGVAEDEKEAALRAIEAGLDIEMMTTCYVNHLKELVESQQIKESLIDEAVLRILRLKKKLGLFEDPYRGTNTETEKQVVFAEEHREVARQLAAKSCVLLKNNDVLPLKTNQKIALIGPFSQSGDLLGPWSWQGSKEDVVQMYDGLKKKLDPSRLIVSKGCKIETGTDDLFQDAMNCAKDGDVVVLALGEHSGMSGEAKCRADIQLPKIQLDLIQTLKQLNKPMVAVLFNGRPLDLHGVVDHVDAVLEAWYPGSVGGDAVADLLFGDVNPSGRLSMSFPYSVGQVPVYYNHFNTGRPKNPNVQEEYVSKYLDIPNEPLFPFGYGLSYTTFNYDYISSTSSHVTDEQPMTLSVDVTNTGKVAGEEVVQLYVRDHFGEVVRPVKELKAFSKIMLQPKETKKVSFTISEKQLRYYHSNLHFASDPGKFTAYIGSNSRDVQDFEFELLR
jgi:beta-glucosidase